MTAVRVSHIGAAQVECAEAVGSESPISRPSIAVRTELKVAIKTVSRREKGRQWTSAVRLFRSCALLAKSRLSGRALGVHDCADERMNASVYAVEVVITQCLTRNIYDNGYLFSDLHFRTDAVHLIFIFFSVTVEEDEYFTSSLILRLSCDLIRYELFEKLSRFLHPIRSSTEI